MNIYMFKEIMSGIKVNDTIGLIKSLSIANKFTTVSIEYDDEFNVLYVADVEKLLNSDITMDDVIQLRENGWEYDEEKNYLFKKI